MINKKNVLRSINIILTIFLLAFSYAYIKSLLSRVDFESISIDIAFVALSAALFIAGYTLFAFNWLFGARIFDRNITKYQLLVFFASQPYKYLPTSLFVFSSRAVFSKKLGLPLKQSSVAQVIENSALFAANFSLFAVLCGIMASTLLGCIVVAVIATILIFAYFKKSIQINIKQKSLSLSTHNLLKMYLLSVLGWIMVGMAFVSLNKSIGLDIKFISLIAANTIAFSLSMLAFFAPGGIGVRELVYSSFSVNALAIIYWRIMVFALDFVVGIPSVVAIKYIENKLASEKLIN
jgi:hypothetical protein